MLDTTLAHLVEKQNNEIIEQLHAMDVDTKKVDKENENQEMKTREHGLDTKEDHMSQQGHHINQKEEVRDT